MRTCTKCNIEKLDTDFPVLKTHGRSYKSGACKHCLNKAAALGVKKYRKTAKGREASKKFGAREREKNKVHYQIKSREYYEKKLPKLKEQIAHLDDEYIINTLQHASRRIKYTRETLKANPEIIELARIKILQTRLRKKIEQLSDRGICQKCNRLVLKAEFKTKTLKKTGKKETVHVCKKCVSEVNKFYRDKKIIKQ